VDGWAALAGDGVGGVEARYGWLSIVPDQPIDPMPGLTVVIPTRAEGGECLPRVLAGLAQQALAVDWEVVVTVDGEGAGPGGAWPFALRVVQGPRGGPGAARNRGAAAARGEVLVFLDDDIVPAAGWAARHWEVQQAAGSRQAAEGRRQKTKGEEAVVGLGKITLPARKRRTMWERYLTARYDEHFVKMGRRGYAPTFWDCLSGSLSVRREEFEAVGGFDPVFTRHEDVELGLRLAERGARLVYVPEAAGEHLYRRGLAAGLADAVGEGESAGVLIRRRPALREQFVAARWRRYGPAARLALRLALAEAGRHARALSTARAWLERVEASPLPYLARRPVYQWAYHLHFWDGMRRSAPDVVAGAGGGGP
jgi:hypothetical protein